jgi:hypothetical protein
VYNKHQRMTVSVSDPHANSFASASQHRPYIQLRIQVVLLSQPNPVLLAWGTLEKYLVRANKSFRLFPFLGIFK